MLANLATATKHKTTHSTIIRLDVPFVVSLGAGTKIAPKMLWCYSDNLLGIAATMAMDTAMRVGGTYLKVSIVQGEVATRLPCKYFLVSTHCCTNTYDREVIMLSSISS